MAKSIVLLVAVLCVSGASAFAATADASAPVTVPTKDVVTRVAVTGATGRTGRLVVEELLDRGVEVVAMVRDLEKAEEAFPSKSDSLTIQECNLVSEEAISASMKDCDAAIWWLLAFQKTPS